LINSDLSIQENHHNKDLGAIVSVAIIEDDLKHLFKVTGAFIGTRSIPYLSRIMVLTKKSANWH
jgi:hypothetical protein